MAARFLLFAVRCSLALKLMTAASFPCSTTNLSKLLYEGVRIDAHPPKSWYKKNFETRQMNIDDQGEETLSNSPTFEAKPSAFQTFGLPAHELTFN